MGWLMIIPSCGTSLMANLFLTSISSTNRPSCGDSTTSMLTRPPQYTPHCTAHVGSCWKLQPSYHVAILSLFLGSLTPFRKRMEGKRNYLICWESEKKSGHWRRAVLH